MADRPALSEKEVEVTPEMIEAGSGALRDIFECGQTISEMAAVDVFEVMIAAMPIDVSIGEAKHRELPPPIVQSGSGILQFPLMSTRKKARGELA